MYFIITFLWSWSFWFLCLLSPVGIRDFKFWVLFIVGAFGPFVSAHVLTLKSAGKEGVKTLWKRLFKPRIKAKWVAFLFLLFPMIMGAAVLLSILIEGFEFTPSFLSQPWLLALEFATIFFYGGPMNEEFGWRGYALDRLQAQWSAITSSALLGVIWACWHLPLFFIAGTSQERQSIPMFIGMVLLLTVLFTFVYNNTGGNLLAAMVFHTMFNLSFKEIPFTRTIYGSLFFGGILILVVILIIIACGSKKLARSTDQAVEPVSPGSN